MPGSKNSQKASKAVINSDTVKPMETDENCVKDGSEVVPAAGHEECKNEEARVSEKCRGESSKKKLVCYLCKGKRQLLHCIKCELAWHAKCAAIPEEVTRISNQPGKAVCWRRHETEKPEVEVPINNIEEVFRRLAVPASEFSIDPSWKNIILGTDTEPPPYVAISRNIYHVEMKPGRCVAGCYDTCSSSVCSEDCFCRNLYISCSKACPCSGMCTNIPFRKEKRIKVVKTEFCGWGGEAAEPIKKGDYIIEYVGEVISDDMCKKRSSDMHCLGRSNIYMCKIEKDFIIDSTYRGNSSRFLNHSCDPNCTLEKWQVDGETRLGIFAARDIEEGEPLRPDYRFMKFGDGVKCQCGSSNCRAILGQKSRRASKVGKLPDCGSEGQEKDKY